MAAFWQDLSAFLSALPVPLLTGAFTVGGVVATILLTGRNDRLRWRREQQVRFHDQRLEAYADFLRDSGEYGALMYSFTRKSEYDPSAPPPQRLEEIYLRVGSSHQRLRLLASVDVAVAAKDVWLARVNFAAEWSSNSSRVQEALTRFEQVARRDLGLD